MSLTLSFESPFKVVSLESFWPWNKLLEKTKVCGIVYVFRNVKVDPKLSTS